MKTGRENKMEHWRGNRNWKGKLEGKTGGKTGRENWKGKLEQKTQDVATEVITAKNGRKKKSRELPPFEEGSFGVKLGRVDDDGK